MLEELEEFFRKFYESELLEAVREGRGYIEVDYEDIDRFDYELAEQLVENPKDFFSEAEKAINGMDLGTEEDIDISVRIKNLPDDEKVRIKDLRSDHLGKLIKVEGTVRRASEVKPELEVAVFECPDCGNVMEIPQIRKKMSYPSRCDNCGRKRGFNQTDRNLIDAKWIHMEDLFEEVVSERPGEVPVYLKGDLTVPELQRKTDPGARLELVGTVREMPKRINGRKTRQLDIFLEANSFEPKEVEFEDLEITEEEEEEIHELSNDEEIYKKLRQSLAPSMYGMQEEKESIILLLFGGVPHKLPDGTKIRGDIHILFVGDPSAGKTQLLKLAASLIPRGRYVSGKGASAAGLTATVVRDEEMMGGWVLEAGALVLAHKGIICIDEFDKMSKEDQVNLHEAMSTQTVSISKATIQTTLPAQTSVIGGANPKFSRFDPYRPIAEQIDISETLLSRFDLKFALRDVPNRDKDEKIVDHIIKSRVGEEDVEPVIESELLKKYIAYARKNCEPEMTEEASAVLKNFYIDLRNRYVDGDSDTVPITLRQYEALQRLSEASAKVRLADRVEKRDAERAMRLMKHSLKQLGMDPETHEIDIDRAEGGTPASERSKIRIVMDILTDLEEDIGKNVPEQDLIAELEDEGVSNPEKVLREMKSKGMVFEPRPGHIQKI
ncbi:MAG: minichromosome maintenance protein MCM [Candidatus Aenigmatarchaeota archaeon]